MTKRHLPKYTYRKGRKGYIYFIRGSQSVRMPDDPTSPDFAMLYAQLLNNRIVAPAKKSMKGLIAKYMQSPRWENLKPNTQKSYRQSFRYLEEKIGQFDPGAIRRKHVIEMRDALADTPTTANRRVGALSVLMEHAINLDWIETNPAKGVENLKGKREKRQPWPENMIEAFRSAADPETLLLFEMLLGTGQRIGDVLGMQWGHIEDGGITVKQGKTGTRLYIPFTERLSAILANQPRRGLYIVSQANGKPPSYNLAWRWIMDVRKEIGAEAWDIHSLRHTAASELAALGLSDEHIMAITGHASHGMVRLYAGPAAQKARAKEAQKARGQIKNKP